MFSPAGKIIHNFKFWHDKWNEKNSCFDLYWVPIYSHLVCWVGYFYTKLVQGKPTKVIAVAGREAAEKSSIIYRLLLASTFRNSDNRPFSSSIKLKCCIHNRVTADLAAAKVKYSFRCLKAKSIVAHRLRLQAHSWLGIPRRQEHE